MLYKHFPILFFDGSWELKIKCRIGGAHSKMYRMYTCAHNRIFEIFQLQKKNTHIWDLLPWFLLPVRVHGEKVVTKSTQTTGFK